MSHRDDTCGQTDPLAATTLSTIYREHELEWDCLPSCFDSALVNEQRSDSEEGRTYEDEVPAKDDLLMGRSLRGRGFLLPPPTPSPSLPPHREASRDVAESVDMQKAFDGAMQRGASDNRLEEDEQRESQKERASSGKSNEFSPSPSRPSTPPPSTPAKVAFESSDRSNSDSPVFGFADHSRKVENKMTEAKPPEPKCVAPHVACKAEERLHQCEAELAEVRLERDRLQQQLREMLHSSLDVDDLATQLRDAKLLVAEQQAVLDRLGLHPPYPESLIQSAVRRLSRRRRELGRTEDSSSSSVAPHDDTEWRVLNHSDLNLPHSPLVKPRDFAVPLSAGKQCYNQVVR